MSLKHTNTRKQLHDLGLGLFREAESEEERRWVADMVERGEEALKEGAEFIDAEVLYEQIRRHLTAGSVK